MGNRLDLHMHSNISADGEYSPSQLIALCYKRGLNTVSLTDHNSIGGNAEAQKTAEELGIEFISGIELDCLHNGVNLHLLGYGIDITATDLIANEDDVLQKEKAASASLIRLVQEQGIVVDTDKVMDLSIQGVVTGEMIAEVALGDSRNIDNPLLQPYRENGLRSDNPYVNFYWDFCSQGKPAHVPIDFISLPEAVAMVKGAGGTAVLAHPGKNIGLDSKLLEGIIACGIHGIEVYSSYHEDSTIAYYYEQAEKYNLLKTMGSDFHGKTKPSIKLGTMVCPQEAEIYRTFLSALKQ